MIKQSVSVTIFFLILNPFVINSQPGSKIVKNPGFQTAMIKPEQIKKTGKDHYFIDFGKDAFGTLVLNIKLSQPDTLVIHLGEKSVTGSRIDKNPGGSIRYQKVLLPVSPLKTMYVLDLPPLSKEKVKEAFGSETIIVHNNSHELFSEIKKMKSEYPVILLMSSGDFDGFNFDRLSEELLSDN